MRLTLNTEEIRLITLFEDITGAHAKDCIMDGEEDVVCFLVEEGKIGDAIGKNGKKVKKVERAAGKRVKLFEFSHDLKKFVKNLIPQTNSVVVKGNDKKIVEIRVNKGNRAFVIGRDRRNLKLYKELLKRNHNVEDLRLR